LNKDCAVVKRDGGQGRKKEGLSNNDSNPNYAPVFVLLGQNVGPCLVLGEGLLNSPAVIGVLVFKLPSLACA